MKNYFYLVISTTEVSADVKHKSACFWEKKNYRCPRRGEFIWDESKNTDDNILDNLIRFADRGCALTMFEVKLLTPYLISTYGSLSIIENGIVRKLSLSEGK